MLHKISLFICLIYWTPITIAQNSYPSKPIRWIIPYATGGGTDVIARPIAIRLSEVLAQQIIYENRGGGGGLIAGEFVAKAAPDGYTLLVGSGNTHTFPTLLFEKIQYDPVKDYNPITNFVNVPNILVSHIGFPAKTTQELISYAKANPGKINWASSGNGSGGHLALVTLAQQAGIKITHIPFKGAGPAVTSILGAESDLLFANTGVFLGHIKSGKLRPITVCAMTRLPLFPNVPTVHESGFTNFESSTYYGLLAPAGTPVVIINRLHSELVKIIKSPDSLERLASVGAIPIANTPEQFAEANKQDVDKWAKVIKEHNIKPD
jgi:tripartite-type tricarboxylate transporter receptor subunit TctC